MHRGNAARTERDHEDDKAHANQERGYLEQGCARNCGMAPAQAGAKNLTPGEMEDLLLRLAEGEALPEERGGTFDLQRFADMKGE